MLVRPFNDARISGSIDFGSLIVGQTHEETFTISADRRSLAAARFVAPNYLPGLRALSLRHRAQDLGIQLNLIERDQVVDTKIKIISHRAHLHR